VAILPVTKKAYIMKTTVNFYMFRDTFYAMGRKEQFTNDGLSALFDYLEEYEIETGEEIELDVIALCCEYQEFSSLADYQEQYGTDCETLDDIRENAVVIEIDDDAFITSEH
jgi:FAD synthase